MCFHHPHFLLVGLKKEWYDCLPANLTENACTLWSVQTTTLIGYRTVHCGSFISQIWLTTERLWDKSEHNKAILMLSRSWKWTGQLKREMYSTFSKNWQTGNSTISWYPYTIVQVLCKHLLAMKCCRTAAPRQLNWKVPPTLCFIWRERALFSSYEHTARLVNKPDATSWSSTKIQHYLT
jgi:hypothetical protein